jgi:hypothetical protein
MRTTIRATAAVFTTALVAFGFAPAAGAVTSGQAVHPVVDAAASNTGWFAVNGAGFTPNGHVVVGFTPYGGGTTDWFGIKASPMGWVSTNHYEPCTTTSSSYSVIAWDRTTNLWSNSVWDDCGTGGSW